MARPSVLDVKSLWKEDVIAAWQLTANHADADKPEKLIEFLAAIEFSYDLRWKRDPEGGEGSVQWLMDLISGEGDL